MKTLQDMDIQDKKVIIRCDFNVPIKDNKIIDDSRIKESLKTIKYCIKNNAKVIILSHLGRIKQKKDMKENNMKIVSQHLSELLKQEVIFSNKTRGIELEKKIGKLKNGQVLLIQNTRYEDLEGKKESSNDEELGKYWASLGDIFINDAFGTIHRKHASNVGIATHLESGIGFLVQKELDALSSLNSPEKPFILILGGGKVADKIGVIENLIKKADYILIGGGMAFTFLQSEGFDIGSSIIDYESINFCSKILNKYQSKIILPIDVITAQEFKDTKNYQVKSIDEIEEDDIGLDIGPNTISLFEKYLKKANVVLWNGPLGVYEYKNFATGTNEILQFLVKEEIKTILGGGDIVAAATRKRLKNKFYHASTGGGATLEYLEGKKLPGLEIIK